MSAVLDSKITLSRSNNNVKLDRYYFSLGDKKGWRFIYAEFGLVEGNGCVAELIIENDEFFSDVMRLTKKDRVILDGNKIGYSPAVSSFKKLDEDVREEIITSLSDSARTLLRKGLEAYTGN